MNNDEKLGDQLIKSIKFYTREKDQVRMDVAEYYENAYVNYDKNNKCHDAIRVLNKNLNLYKMLNQCDDSIGTLYALAKK